MGSNFNRASRRFKSRLVKNPSKAKLLKEVYKIYYHPAEEEVSYGGIQKLLRTAKAKGLKVSENSIIVYLGRQASCSLHKL